MDPLRLKVNLTAVFALPMLYDNNLKHSDILTDTFINTYIADLDKPENDNTLLIQYATITNLPKWTHSYDVYSPDEEAIMVKYEIPDKHMDDYQKILTGDYSKLNESYKQKILDFWEANEDTLLYGVLTRSGEQIKKFWVEVLEVDLEVEARQNTEYWNPPNLKKEIFGMGNVE